jgi:hypothetical protein
VKRQNYRAGEGLNEVNKQKNIECKIIKDSRKEKGN